MCSPAHSTFIISCFLSSLSNNATPLTNHNCPLSRIPLHTHTEEEKQSGLIVLHIIFRRYSISANRATVYGYCAPYSRDSDVKPKSIVCERGVRTKPRCYSREMRGEALQKSIQPPFGQVFKGCCVVVVGGSRGHFLLQELSCSKPYSGSLVQGKEGAVCRVSPLPTA